MIKKIIFIILYATFIVSCNKDKGALTVNTSGVTARMVDEGDPSVDGCGWHIISDAGTDYIPKNLDPAFETDNLAVTISFNLDGKLPCGYYNVPHYFPAILLTSIQKK